MDAKEILDTFFPYTTHENGNNHRIPTVDGWELLEIIEKYLAVPEDKRYE